MRVQHSLAMSLLLALAPAAQVYANTQAQQVKSIYTVSGKITDTQGNAISGAKVHYHGKTRFVLTDASGQFSISLDSKGELHIAKSGFQDIRVAVDSNTKRINPVLEKAAIESVVVYASAFHKNSLDMASPVAVLGQDDLKNATASSLGETLITVPGVNSTYYGPASSAPVIRGLDGPRVKVLQNGLASGDVSTTGADHANTNESLTAEQIEILKGPATLMYGSGAIGGVVNVVDNRIPTNPINGVSGALDVKHSAVNNEKTFAGTFDAGTEQFAFHIDGVNRDAGNTETPEYTIEDEGEIETLDEIENSAITTKTINIGTSYLGSHLTVGAAWGHIDSRYGIPGHHEHHHGHGHEDEHEEHEEHEAHGDEHGEEGVLAHIIQDRYQGLVSYSFDDALFEKVEARFGYTNTEQRELEEGEIGTKFNTELFESRVHAEYQAANWHGVLGYQLEDHSFAAAGEEAFTPNADRKSQGVYWLTEKEIGPVTFELGARFETVSIDAMSMEEEHHDHDEHEEDHADHDEEHSNEHHDEEHHDEIAYSTDEDAFSASFGIVYDLSDAYTITTNLSHSSRVPLSQELLANGLHLATSTYEVGALFHIEEDGHVHFEPTNINNEVATNLDISLRKTQGDFGFNLTAFYNDVSDFYSLVDTGYRFDEGELVLASDADEDALSVFQYTTQDVELYGLELDAHYQFNASVSVEVFADVLRAKTKAGEYLARQPGDKLGAKFSYQLADWELSTTLTHRFAQNKVALGEESTDSYQLISVAAQYYLPNLDGQVYLKLDNITDELGYVHNSFIKEQAPLPGRNITLGMRVYF